MSILLPKTILKLENCPKQNIKKLPLQTEANLVAPLHISFLENTFRVKNSKQLLMNLPSL